MRGHETTPHDFGREVLGPIIAEFSLRLWSLAQLFEERDKLALLFCARGGLRLQQAYERFLAAAALPAPALSAPLMVSRLVAIRPALVRALRDDCDDLGPAVSNTLAYEFSSATVAEVARVVSGVPVPDDERWNAPYRSDALLSLLRSAEGTEVVDALRAQADSFSQHLDESRQGRNRLLVIDTGLFGTTREVLAEGYPDLSLSSALMVRLIRGARPWAGTYGLSVDAYGYSPLNRRTAILRHWHFMEWIFEPALESVKTFMSLDGRLRSNLEIEGWRERVAPDSGSPFAGALAYIDALDCSTAVARTVSDADGAWSRLRRNLVWPDPPHGRALQVGRRSHDFGRDDTWIPRPDPGPLAALRGSTMWREGEVARSESPLRRPVLAAVEAAYAFRELKRVFRRSVMRSPL